MDRIRIGCVKYLNTLPLTEGLQMLRDVELIAAVPSRLIGMLRGGEVDVALASIVDAVGGVAEGREAKGESEVIALPVGMIGCDGPTLTVRLFSRVPIEKITSVGADTDSHTSVVLMQVILARRYGVQVKMLDFDAREQVMVGAGGNTTTDALLLIGDKVVTDAPSSAEFPHQLDLGQAWKELTGLPFVYAVWMCRAGEENSLAVRTAAAVLDRQRRHNATRLNWLVAKRAPERHWPTDLAGRYVGSYLKYSIEEPEREAVEKFVMWGHELGLCASGPVRWSGLEL